MGVAGSDRSTLYAAPPGHLTLIMAARKSASYTLPSDPRFSFYVYTPRGHPITRRARGEDVGVDGVVTGPKTVSLTDSPMKGTFVFGRGAGPRGFGLMVVIHDSKRDAEKLRDEWADIAEEEGCVLLSPCFPCDIKFPDGPDNFKKLEWETATGEIIRYDEVLLSMIDTVEREWGCVDTRTFALIGFSGGGQFVHRFLYLYPERLHAVSIGAPGRATPLIDEEWPAGIRGALTRRDGKGGIDLKKLAERTQSGETVVQLLIGDQDHWRPVQPDGTLAPMSRLDCTNALKASFDAHGIKYGFKLVPGVKHDAAEIRAVSKPWIRKYVRRADNLSPVW